MNPVRWQVVLDVPRPGWQNMAIDSALLDLAAGEGAAFLRLYAWEPHCLSFGRHEPALRRYDRAAIDRLGLDCVRRPTGGRAVWHARELTYAVAAPLACFGGMPQAYAALHRVLAAAIGSLGAGATLADPAHGAPGLGSGPCFAAPVGGEVLVAGRKVVGSAQLRQREAFLQHGSILLEDDQSLVRSLAGLPPGAAAELPLAAALGRRPGRDEVTRAILAAGSALWGDGAPEAGPSPQVEEAARRHTARFRSEAWTWER